MPSRPEGARSPESPSTGTAGPGGDGRSGGNGGSTPLPFLVKYAKYVVVGLTGVVVNLVVFSLVLVVVLPSGSFDLMRAVERLTVSTTSNPTDNFLASTAAFAVATLSNFAFNNAWTFRTSSVLRHRVHERLGLYFGVSLVALAVNELVLFALTGTLPPLYGQAVGIAAGSVVGFAGNLRVSFAEAPGRPTENPHRASETPPSGPSPLRGGAPSWSSEASTAEPEAAANR